MKINRTRLRQIINEELQMKPLDENGDEMVSVPRLTVIEAIQAFEDIAMELGNDADQQEVVKTLKALLQSSGDQNLGKFDGLAFANSRE